MIMTCDEVLRFLPEYLIGELPDDRNQAIRDHMVPCTNCAFEFARVQSIARRISMGRTGTLPDSYFSRFPNEVMKRIKKSVSPQRTRQYHGNFRQVLLASGAVAAAIALVLLFIWPNRHFNVPGDTARRGIPTEIAVISDPSDEELSSEIGSLDLSESGGAVDLLYSADPWEALPDISDDEWEILLDELSQESS